MGSSIRLAMCCQKNWLYDLCKSFGGSRLWSFGTRLLLILLVPFSTPLYLTTFMMLSNVGRGAHNFSSCVATCLQSVGHSMPQDSNVVPVMEVTAHYCGLT